MEWNLEVAFRTDFNRSVSSFAGDEVVADIDNELACRVSLLTCFLQDVVSIAGITSMRNAPKKMFIFMAKCLSGEGYEFK